MLFLEAQPEKPILEVIVKEHKKDRSVAQNRLMWNWITIIANELGMTKEDVHEDFKKRLLVPIYERDDDGYAEMINAIRKIYSDGFKSEALKMHNHIVKLTSTTAATVKEFSEYLNEIEKDSIEKGIILPHPEDMYAEAMN